jgi:prepilin-type processing-associated H-X9-DG protein
MYPVIEGDNALTNYAQTDALANPFWFSKWSKGDPNCWGPAYRFSSIAEPSGKVLLMDARDHTISVVAIFSGGMQYRDIQIPGDGNGHPIHNNGINALYADGHVTWEDWPSFVDLTKIQKFFPDW